jgi:hypothetical protein
VLGDEVPVEIEEGIQSEPRKGFEVEEKEKKHMSNRSRVSDPRAISKAEIFEFTQVLGLFKWIFVFGKDRMRLRVLESSLWLVMQRPDQLLSSR